MATAVGVAGYVVGRTSGLAKPPDAGQGQRLWPFHRRRHLPGGGERLPPHGGGLILASDHVVLVREVSGQLKAFSSTCTHQGCTVAAVANGIIQRPCHGSQFSAVNGAVVNGPATARYHR